MARHLEETDIPIEYRGMKYNVSPSALRSNNLTVELPEVKVLGKRKNKGYKSAFDPNGAGEFVGAMMNSPLQLGDYAFNRFIDASKGEHGKTDYRYTPVQTTVQRVGETVSPTRWIGTARSGFKKSLWNEDNPGLWGDKNLDMMTDLIIGAGLTKVPYRKIATNVSNTANSYKYLKAIEKAPINSDKLLNDAMLNDLNFVNGAIRNNRVKYAPHNRIQVGNPKSLRSLGKDTDIRSFYNFIDEFKPSIKLSTKDISRFQGKSPIPTGHKGLIGYRPKQKLTIWDDAANDLVVDKRFRNIDDIPKLRETINSILSRVKTEDIRPEFLNENAYVNSFRDNASRQFINVNDLSHEDIAKILTEQYKQLSSTSNGILKDNVLWRTWGESLPQPEFNWQEHIGSSSGNKGFWGQGNYFGTGVYGNDIINQPYMIKGIKEIGYDDLFGATKAADEASRNGKLSGRELATKWMSESPETRMVAATEQGLRNEYGWLDTHDKGIEVVTQKNKGIKALNPDLTNGNGTTFVRDWNNPNVFRAIAPYITAGTTSYLLNKVKHKTNK